jgi:D-alanyl-D-alanine carboxypeptidase/D-alanyl-D-alanine-endopeptidase (penicillin-binding protein 4)
LRGNLYLSFSLYYKKILDALKLLITMLRFILCWCLLIGSVQITTAQSKLEAALTNLEQDPELKHASISFCAIDIRNNTIYAQRNANKALTPASSMKVITTGAALATLGADYTFDTYLEYSGSISQGTLRGNLYVRGTGDPCLASPIMEGVPDRAALLAKFVAAVQKAGIQRIEGTVIGDGSYFEDQVVVPTWQWGDVGNHYGAGVSGLNYYDNLYYIYFNRTNTFGETPKISHTDPVIPNLTLDNRVTQAGSRTGDNAYVFSAPFGQQAIIRGTIPKGSGLFDIKGATPDPALLLAHNLREALIAKGIGVTRLPTTQRQYQRSESRRILLTHRSPKLSAICKHTNEDSRNMYCEALLKAMGAKVKGKGTTDMGIAVVMDLWRTRGLDLSGFFMKDGCGLSARNGVSAKTFAAIMRKMYLDKSSFGDFYNQLAIAGRSGTLRNVGRNSVAENNVRAKSGSMNRIRSYTGYVTTQSGRLLSFSILVNNYSCSGYRMRKKLETLLVAMAATS